MSRLKNFSRNLATSYAQLGVNVIYSLVSIPLILFWLPPDEFGMWALLMQLMGYITMLDLGMTGAVARLLVDHKDERSNGNYGSLVSTAFVVSLVQALIILLVTFFGSSLLASLMNIPGEHLSTFVLLMQLQGGLMAYSFAMRPLGMMLYAHQRQDIQQKVEMGSQVAQLGLLVFFLMQGHGIFSFIYANAITALLGPGFLFWSCQRLRLLPHVGEWGGVTARRFHEVFSYGINIFVMGLGVQLIMASQVIIVSRTLGLGAAAAWAVGTKIFSLCTALMCRPYGAALPGLYEMAARHETGRLYERFRSMVVLTASLGVFLGVGLGLCNSLFVGIWTSGKITWTPWNDLFLGLWIFFSSLQTTHVNFVNVTKQFKGARYIYFLEGVSFVCLSMVMGYRGGIVGILLVSNLCQLLFSCQYGFRLSSQYFQRRWIEVAFEWISPSLKFAGLFVPVAVLVWFLTLNLVPIWRLLIHGVVVVTVGGYGLIKFGLPRQMLVEMEKRLPRPAAKFLRLLVFQS